MACLTKLQRLDASSNRLKTLPEAFGNLIALKICNLSKNVLTALPDQFGSLAKLQTLWLQQNNLMDLPPSFRDLRALENLSLSGNRMDAFPGRHLQTLDRIRIFSFAENRLRSWSSSEEVDGMEKNPIDRIGLQSNELFGMRNVEFLEFADNLIPALPSRGWSLLEQLVELRLRNNKLTELPPSLSELKRLELLDLGKNQLKTVPEEMMQLPQLKKLDLQNNALEALPDNIHECQTLLTLVVVKNKTLGGIPSGICKLQQLKWLHMDKTCFLGLSDRQIQFCESLETFITD